MRTCNDKEQQSGGRAEAVIKTNQGRVRFDCEVGKSLQIK